MTLHPKLRTLALKPISWVLLFGCSLRVYVAVTRGIIGHDGHHYIYQAQAIFSGDWSGILACDLKYISIYPFFIAAANALFGDWIVAAVFVNVVFGSATLFVLYFLIHRYADEAICALTLLVYALIPTFVFSSTDVVRGPMFWFFLSLAMLMFIRQWDKCTNTNRFRWDLLMSCCFYLLAAWARIEGVVLIGASAFYLIITQTDRKWERLIIFLGPVVCLLLTAIAVVLVSQHDVANTFRLEQATNAITEFAQRYAEVDTQIKEAYRQQNWFVSDFLHRISEALWLIPFAIIVHNVIEVVFYPFALIYFVGLFTIRKKLQTAHRAGYYIWLVVASIGMLYINMFHTAVMIHRFFAILILPSFVIIAHGVETACTWIQKKYSLKPTTAITILVAFFIITGLPKVAKPKAKEDALFREAAQLIAVQKTTHQIARIAAAKKSSAYGYVFLYAHRKYPNPLCTREHFVDIAMGKDYSRLVATLDRENIRYLLYEERYWPKQQIDFLAAPYQQDFQLLGQWKLADSNMLMLFERVQGSHKN